MTDDRPWQPRPAQPDTPEQPPGRDNTDSQRSQHGNHGGLAPASPTPDVPVPLPGDDPAPWEQTSRIRRRSLTGQAAAAGSEATGSTGTTARPGDEPRSSYPTAATAGTTGYFSRQAPPGRRESRPETGGTGSRSDSDSTVVLSPLRVTPRDTSSGRSPSPGSAEPAAGRPGGDLPEEGPPAGRPPGSGVPRGGTLDDQPSEEAQPSQPSQAARPVKAARSGNGAGPRGSRPRSPVEPEPGVGAEPGVGGRFAGVLLTVAGGLGGIAATLPWSTISDGEETRTFTGLTVGDGRITLMVAVVLLVIGAAHVSGRRPGGTEAAVATLLGAGVAVFAVMDLVAGPASLSSFRTLAADQISVAPASGLVLTLVAGLLALVGGWLLRRGRHGG